LAAAPTKQQQLVSGVMHMQDPSFRMLWQSTKAKKSKQQACTATLPVVQMACG
jgi:hypothetical protein